MWVDRHGSGWADPDKHQEVWDYNIHILEKAARGWFPRQFNSITSVFSFRRAHQTVRLLEASQQSERRSARSNCFSSARTNALPKNSALNYRSSVFGLTGSTDDDMGIGQKLGSLIKHVDVISPMMYPSHYARGEYGIANPNESPYETIHHSIRDTKRVLGESSVELRPYLQDFSLMHVKYGGEGSTELKSMPHQIWESTNGSCGTRLATTLKRRFETTPDEKPARRARKNER